MTNLLEKELNSFKEKQSNNLTKKIGAEQEVKLLLENAGQRDVEIMRHVAKNSLLVAGESSFGKFLELEKLDEEYAGNIFHIDAIQALCVDYHLRFLNSSLFTGFMDVEAIAKIKEFGEKTNTSLDQHTLATRFFIMAPPEAFTLTVNEKETVKQVIDRDPLLFYKVDEPHYRLIHKWGKDFSILRRISGWKWENANNFRHFYVLMSLPIIATLFALICPLFMASHAIVSSLVIFAASYLFGMLCTSAVCKNEAFRYDNDFFTPTNWNSDKFVKWIN